MIYDILMDDKTFIDFVISFPHIVIYITIVCYCRVSPRHQVREVSYLFLIPVSLFKVFLLKVVDHQN